MGSQYARISAGSLAIKRIWAWNSVLSSFTAPALALAMCLRTASVVSSTRVLGRWNLRVAVDTRRQGLYRLRRVGSAANTSSDLIALIAPLNRNFLFGIKNGTIVHPSGLFATP